LLAQCPILLEQSPLRRNWFHILLSTNGASCSYAQFENIMASIQKTDLSECDICTQFITPAIQQADWDLRTQVREEMAFTNGQIIMRSQLISWGNPVAPTICSITGPTSRSLSSRPKTIRLGLCQVLNVLFVYSSTGGAFLEHDRSVRADLVEPICRLKYFSHRMRSGCVAWKGLSAPAQQVSLRTTTAVAAGTRHATISSP
jgi:hypothetical protein